MPLLRRNTLINMTLLAGIILSGCTPIPAGPPPTAERNATGDLIPYSNIENKSTRDWGPVTHKDPRPAEIVDQTHLRIQFSGGDGPACTRYDAEVTETPDTITITLFVGSIPHAKELCKPTGEIINLAGSSDTMMIETKSPIGNRKIIDGGAPHTYD